MNEIDDYYRYHVKFRAKIGGLNFWTGFIDSHFHRKSRALKRAVEFLSKNNDWQWVMVVDNKTGSVVYLTTQEPMG